MKSNLKGTILGLCVLGLASTASAQERGSEADAKNIVKTAVDMFKADGADKLFEEGNKPDGKFRKKDVYLFVYKVDDPAKAVSMVHANPKMVSKDLVELRDGEGFYINKKIIEICQKDKKGEVNYKWPNAVTKAVEPKRSFVECVGPYALVAGYYL